MGYVRLYLPNQLPFFLAILVSSAVPVIAQRDSVGTGERAKKISTEFIDTTSTLGIDFRNMASHTSKKYVTETMGPGVALFDYDNDGRLDIFVVNGAPLTASRLEYPLRLSRKQNLPRSHKYGSVKFMKNYRGNSRHDLPPRKIESGRARHTSAAVCHGGCRGQIKEGPGRRPKTLDETHGQAEGPARGDRQDYQSHRRSVRRGRSGGVGFGDAGLILDTNALSAAAGEHPGVMGILAGTQQLALPAVVIGEYRYGFAQSRHKARYRRWLNGLITDCTVLDITGQTTHHYAAISVELRQEGKPIPTNDLWIAALCRQHGLPFLSRDRDFNRVSGIRRLDW